ncbi:nickel-dependent hydrogenase large subunit [Haloechinothrix halophila]|uniref:nickel-dependent hydrogenase large subunit n=1 Tax=Haloechinothrix halophila TaxID=1069073 RepID=UPI000425F337|nr:nickel-dependent hydrogenase large subunit [Haloechinothrix halophila]
MCFKNLPIEFDANGNAQLKQGIPDPYAITTSSPDVRVTDAEREAKIQRLLAANGHVKDINMDPVTRVAGALAVNVTADLDNRVYLDARSQATLFRGYEVILMGRDPRDAIFVSSRACGVCGGVHSHCSAYAIEMAMGLRPPPLGTVVRNMQEAAEMGYDNPLHLYLLAGPDYSESVVKAVNPELWPKAERWHCPNEKVHGFKTMAELMTELNPLTGKLYQEGLEFTRLSREMFAVLAGKYPHPQTVVPGGVSSTVTMQTLNEYHSKLGRLFDYAQRMLGVWNDIPEFFYECDERYKQVGARPMTLIDPGFWDDPYAYDATYENCNDWGARRWSTPGVLIDGELVTTRLTDINIGWEEFVEHSYYEQWAGDRYSTDPLGNPIGPYHPWNKRTLPSPTGKSWKDKYTWACTPRWDRNVVEAGAYARLFTTAMAGLQPHNDFIEATGHSLRMRIPKGTSPQSEVEWHVPEVWNALERNRGRAYHYLFSQLVGMLSLLEAYNLFKQGERKVAAVPPAELDDHIPSGERVGMGWWGAGRGWLTHHLVMDDGKIANYQICTPSTINASPRDPWDQPGPYEESVMNTPIIEDADPEKFTSIDMLRTIRSFDPCMPCTTHVHTGAGTVMREVNTCSCGAD